MNPSEIDSPKPDESNRTGPETESPTRRRWGLRFSLRTLIVFMLVLSTVGGLYASFHYRARKEQNVIEAFGPQAVNQTSNNLSCCEWSIWLI